MSKLSAVLSKKVPIPGLEYSSQQFSCGLEIELSGEQTQDSIRQNIRKLYALLHAAVDEEIREAAVNTPAFLNRLQTASPRSQFQDDGETSRWRGRSYGNNRQNRWNGVRGGNPRGIGGSGRPGNATQAQVKAIFAIAKQNGLERRDLFEQLQERFNVQQVELLSVRQASAFIESLKQESIRE